MLRRQLCPLNPKIIVEVKVVLHTLTECRICMYSGSRSANTSRHSFSFNHVQKNTEVASNFAAGLTEDTWYWAQHKRWAEGGKEKKDEIPLAVQEFIHKAVTKIEDINNAKQAGLTHRKARFPESVNDAIKKTFLHSPRMQK
ncbi:hypothetical protein NDU88_006018 [Pleurodeles waltl]|uniref:Uncharacterized protein n=1 Tax=Pleurodeles waltl TaxID=8319 RepID=A0AAV7RNX5_PLEWA|nr:hypothetical protein NDU88_006018 [Pleurodeles waltl]